ncbi:DUF1080 domain-containing protein [Bacteroidota bacterium]
MLSNVQKITAILFLSVLLSDCNFETSAEDEFISLFNGENLDGWVNVNCAPETWTIRDGLIICSGIPTGILRTDRQYENFILELEWMHLNEGGNAGLFIHSDDITAPGKPFSRSVECQIMDGNHGDVFAIHGARMTRDNEDPFDRIGWMRTFPSQERANPAGEWNLYRVESRDGMLTLAVNGEVVSRAFHVNPRKGYICLESEGSETHFRNIRIKKLPGTSPLQENTAMKDRDFKSLYNGLDLRGWKLDPGDGSWKADNWKLVNEGNIKDVSGRNLWTKKEFENFKLIIDWRLTGEPVAKSVPVIMPDGRQAEDRNGEKITVPIRYSGEGGIIIHGSNDIAIMITSWPEGSGGISGYREEGVFETGIRRITTPILNADNDAGSWNRFEITIIGQKISVALNSKEVVRNATIKNLPEKGSIGLQIPDFPVEFANIYIKEL